VLIRGKEPDIITPNIYRERGVMPLVSWVGATLTGVALVLMLVFRYRDTKKASKTESRNNKKS
jgi:hypothetical protein